MSDDVSKLSDFFFFDPATRFILQLLVGSGTKWAHFTFTVNVHFSIQGSARGLVVCSAGLLSFFYFLTLAPHDYVTYYQARELAVGVWPPVSIRQDMGHTIRGGPAHKIKARMALADVHRKILYSTK